MRKRVFWAILAGMTAALLFLAAVTVLAVYFQASAQLAPVLIGLLLAAVPALALGAWLARWLSGRVVDALNRPEAEQEVSKELSPVLERLDLHRQQQAERSRQEFSANVSHELKTPLQSIIGSAELLENNLVKPEDTPRFVGHIKTEATRLVNLINDIIRLSQLDENSEEVRESVDLYEVTQEVLEELAGHADKRQVTLALEGRACVIRGIRRYLYEIVFNLCDNAIRYNVEGGRVTVRLRHDRHGAILTVEDTGIGIPREHQSRIFERFYRVDKSHSKKTGGTGLGLSIVKHAVAIHGGRITLDSTPNKGTTIRVYL